jgi:hypothetical protein
MHVNVVCSCVLVGTAVCLEWWIWELLNFCRYVNALSVRWVAAAMICLEWWVWELLIFAGVVYVFIFSNCRLSLYLRFWHTISCGCMQMLRSYVHS